MAYFIKATFNDRKVIEKTCHSLHALEDLLGMYKVGGAIKIEVDEGEEVIPLKKVYTWSEESERDSHSNSCIDHTVRRLYPNDEMTLADVRQKILASPGWLEDILLIESERLKLAVWKQTNRADRYIVSHSQIGGCVIVKDCRTGAEIVLSDEDA